jgi:ribonuclease HII
MRNHHQTTFIEAGCDEVGRGCLAGPVVAAAVILPTSYFHPLLNDSKKVLPANRSILTDHIKKHALAWAIGEASHQEIDTLNIAQASYLAMHRAIAQLSIQPQLLLIDGLHFKPFPPIPHHCFVRGDAQYMSIAAASIIAKTYRDGYMQQLAKQFPGYGWETNVGYPTRTHQQAIHAQGITPYHRRTYRTIFTINQSN